ncbi:leukotriene A-4 hydrolase/aminopeptidase [Colletotrichum scovillei]|uniref:Leukotriene A(4) hydrolase n=1 Tax=Colletotrichum scovillei TaxID=1209932 RepID=A0A9P7RCK6_9PEZI|nr:leukotriene A-4 hydrolase/aminopeptidase [Colletotrichum scovillei]KAF4786075.1 leukotriene A-4 hydrolase/aminopeptidase [Colletotrichum scovillei]KAG7055005.1 leukotriene a-4 hydrolase [Colletotrichum scovillei]KAG7074423.1 leukotriene a-4 hydrolase [Colletotrichum scovillei]KAG7081533.1 leukotriene a-4 hydrolase [Colletotrichum scovillei]
MWRSLLAKGSIPIRTSFTRLTNPQSRAAAFGTTAKMASTTSANRDPNTLSNYGAWLTKHTTANLTIDFKDKSLKGSVTLELESLTDSQSKEIILDSSFLSISGVKVNAATSTWELKDRVEPYGAPLHVFVPQGAAKGEVVKVDVDLATTDKCTALQWLTPAQTSNKKHPYMFSQCQAIHARSLFPCQDTPDVKSTYSFVLASPLPVVASGVLVEGSGKDEKKGDDTVYRFEQKVPIPSYLFALASGDIATAPIGPRSIVATGPDELKESQWELQNDMEKFMEVAEKLVFPYRWGQYNVLVLPPSFPYGGMENPIYTFATPTIISGDKQNVDVIAHELSHSWSGNLVTSCSWEHFWLNEGWTTYLERRIGMAVHGDAERDFSAIIGWKALEDAVALNGADSEFTKLIINHKGIDPDDAFSTVPYEKGFHFLYYLERLVGMDAFDKFIPHYFTKWSRKSLDSFEFKDTFLTFFNGLGDEEIKNKVASIDWDTWFYQPGLPPKPAFDTTLADVCYKLAENWKDESFKPSAEDVASFSGNQKLVLLETIEKFPSPLSADRAKLLGTVYDLVSSRNAELKTAYYKIALAAEDSSAYQGAAELLGHVGRMKFVRPLFRSLNKVDRELALKTFEKNRDFYHPICRGMVEKDLGLV